MITSVYQPKITGHLLRSVPNAVPFHTLEKFPETGDLRGGHTFANIPPYLEVKHEIANRTKLIRHS